MSYSITIRRPILACGIFLALSTPPTMAQDKADYANGDASNGFSPQAYPMSQNGWARNGFTPEERDQLMAAGLPSGDEAIKWMSITGEHTKMPPSTVGEYYRAGQQYGFAADDLRAVFDAIAQNPPRESLPDQEIYREAAAVHRGSNATALYRDYTDLAAKKKVEAETLGAIGQYGSEVVKACGGAPTDLPLVAAFDDPYAPKGKCFTTTIAVRWGQKQWLDEHTLLITNAMPGTAEVYPAIFNDPKGHLKYGSRALVVGSDPITYTSVLGAQTVAPTFVVVKYLN
ncbi:hypothetical protein [Asaia sp. VD9]|uniref:hypothetical protein n=1 Tax=Asaia sp. VD9 TaxID=3081235 RepID=UPI00301B18FD